MAGYRRLVVNRRVIVNLVGDRAFDGVLVRQSGPLLVLKGAVLLVPGAEPAPLDGEVVIERDRVDFIQAL
jgi:small nuclear ribonucleoprotein (snRNP)-like protein